MADILQFIEFGNLVTNENDKKSKVLELGRNSYQVMIYQKMREDDKYFEASCLLPNKRVVALDDPSYFKYVNDVVNISKTIESLQNPEVMRQFTEAAKSNEFLAKIKAKIDDLQAKGITLAEMAPLNIVNALITTNNVTATNMIDIRCKNEDIKQLWKILMPKSKF